MNEDRTGQPGRALNLVGVKLHDAERIVPYDAGQLALRGGDQVVVETDHGNRLGTVVSFVVPRPPAESNKVQRIIHKADNRDLEKDDRNRVRERDALRVCFERVRERALPMKLIKAEQALDGGKIIFYFAAEQRVDFRELVRELAHTFHTRIEMKQIGSRDEAKVIGAVGPCGRELCCSTFLREPGGVSVKMARVQGLSLNPTKLAGMCGRLKCCLRYEYDTYLELGRALPAIGKSVESVKGEGVVTRQNVLKQTVLIRRADGVETEASLEDLVEKKAQ